MTTIKEVARRAGVAPASVTRVLSGHPNVSEALRAKVLAAVDEIGYKPDLMAAGLRRGSSHTVGVIVSDIINPLLAEMVDALDVKLRDKGYTVLLANSHGDPDRDVESVHLLRQRRTDGLVVMVVDETRAELRQALRDLPIPVVLLDRQIETADAASAVLSDHHRGTRELTRHLLDGGHRRIALLTGLRGTTYPGRERTRGFVDALDERDIPVASAFIRDARATPESGQRLAAELLDDGDPPTAIVVGPNPMLVGVLRELQRRNLRVGRDLALACLDDIPIAALHHPPITALARNTEEMAHTAAALLLDRLTGVSRFPRTVVLPTELRRRASTTALVTPADAELPVS
ncbi:LacI family DNA-binding transcriptional regulator [Phytohabitans flavus]|uniref:LacI family transcriptional regulator n=1 Tax=Phytohabitans flavus TaxID=1076124 RepID=A0A6F8XWR7_9ACTN|nr:LacI family DNA-binding transcriptional regulator [Phytohabitans flavus]BCB78237.1 LacI family transcriptional regulator [Phytohabitans flavus]